METVHSRYMACSRQVSGFTTPKRPSSTPNTNLSLLDSLSDSVSSRRYSFVRLIRDHTRSKIWSSPIQDSKFSSLSVIPAMRDNAIDWPIWRERWKMSCHLMPRAVMCQRCLIYWLLGRLGRRRFCITMCPRSSDLIGQSKCFEKKEFLREAFFDSSDSVFFLGYSLTMSTRSERSGETDINIMVLIRRRVPLSLLDLMDTSERWHLYAVPRISRSISPGSWVKFERWIYIYPFVIYCKFFSFAFGCRMHTVRIDDTVLYRLRCFRVPFFFPVCYQYLNPRGFSCR